MMMMMMSQERDIWIPDATFLFNILILCNDTRWMLICYTHCRNEMREEIFLKLSRGTGENLEKSEERILKHLRMFVFSLGLMGRGKAYIALAWFIFVSLLENTSLSKYP